ARRDSFRESAPPAAVFNIEVTTFDCEHLLGPTPRFPGDREDVSELFVSRERQNSLELALADDEITPSGAGLFDTPDGGCLDEPQTDGPVGRRLDCGDGAALSGLPVLRAVEPVLDVKGLQVRRPGVGWERPCERLEVVAVPVKSPGRLVGLTP